MDTRRFWLKQIATNLWREGDAPQCLPALKMRRIHSAVCCAHMHDGKCCKVMMPLHKSSGSNTLTTQVVHAVHRHSLAIDPKAYKSRQVMLDPMHTKRTLQCISRLATSHRNIHLRFKAMPCSLKRSCCCELMLSSLEPIQTHRR